MRGNVRVHGLDDAEVVHLFAEVRENFADFDAGFSFFGKLERRRHRHAAHAGNFFAVHLGERRFVIPSVQMRRRALRKNVDDVLGLRGQRRRFRQQVRLGLDRVRGAGEQAFTQKRREAQRAKAHARALQELAAGEKVIFEVHQLMLVGVHRI